MNILRAENIHIAVDDRILVKNLDIAFRSGEVWGIFGPNGVGKTTLLHILAGLQIPKQGQVFLRDGSIHTLASRQRAQQVGLLFQDIEFSFPSTVMESVLMGRYPHRTGWFGVSQEDRDKAYQALVTMQLQGFEHRLASSLSGGEKRRLMLATLLAQDPTVYLLDEPTNHLDWHQQMRALSWLSLLAKERGKVVIMVMHDVHLMRRFCDRVIILHPTATHHIGDSAEWLQERRIQEIFGDYAVSDFGESM